MRRLGMFFLVCALCWPGSLAWGADSSVPTVESLGHVGLPISDLQPALHFYIDQLGLKEAFRIALPDGANLIFLRVGDSNTFLELFPGRKTPTPANATTVNHVGLYMKDLQATLRALETAKKVTGDKNLHYFIKDPDGNRIELSQLRPDSLQLTSGNRK